MYMLCTYICNSRFCGALQQRCYLAGAVQGSSLCTSSERSTYVITNRKLACTFCQDVNNPPGWLTQEVNQSTLIHYAHSSQRFEHDLGDLFCGCGGVASLLEVARPVGESACFHTYTIHFKVWFIPALLRYEITIVD